MPASAGMTEIVRVLPDVRRGQSNPQVIGSFVTGGALVVQGAPAWCFALPGARYSDSRVISSFMRSFCRLSSVM